MRAGRCAAMCLAAMLAGCGGAPVAVVHGGSPLSYLLRLDQLAAPGFTEDVAPHSLSAADVSAAGGAAATEMVAAGFTAAATVEFFRAVSRLDLPNGPVQVADRVVAFSAPSGAAAVYGSDVARLDRIAGSRTVSTGPLGDAAHASERTVTSAAGVHLVQLTVEWRTDNLLTILVLRGREAGTRLDDALLLAHRQTVAELGLLTPMPPTTATPRPR